MLLKCLLHFMSYSFPVPQLFPFLPSLFAYIGNQKFFPITVIRVFLPKTCLVGCHHVIYPNNAHIFCRRNPPFHSSLRGPDANMAATGLPTTSDLALLLFSKTKMCFFLVNFGEKKLSQFLENTVMKPVRG